jgi:hypothetical protein
MAPDKRNDGTLEDLLKWIRAGNNVTDSCMLAGISRETYYRWKDDADISYKIELAEKECKARVIAHWQNKIPTDWKAARDWLERKYKDEFSPRTDHNNTVTVKTNAAQELADAFFDEIAGAEQSVGDADSSSGPGAAAATAGENAEAVPAVLPAGVQDDAVPVPDSGSQSVPVESDRGTDGRVREDSPPVGEDRGADATAAVSDPVLPAASGNAVDGGNSQSQG